MSDEAKLRGALKLVVEDDLQYLRMAPLNHRDLEKGFQFVTYRDDQPCVIKFHGLPLELKQRIGRRMIIEEFCKEKWMEALVENAKMKAKLEKQAAQIGKLGDDRFMLTLENDALKEEIGRLKFRKREAADLPAGEGGSEPPAKRPRAESDGSDESAESG